MKLIMKASIPCNFQNTPHDIFCFKFHLKYIICKNYYTFFIFSYKTYANIFTTYRLSHDIDTIKKTDLAIWNINTNVLTEIIKATLFIPY